MSQTTKTCGACSVCCKEMMLEIGGAPKLSGVMCPHATPPHGCAIHQTRPQVCRDWFCGWYFLPSLGEEWRPDASEVLISFRKGPAPDGLTDGIEFELVGSHDRLSWLPLVRYIATLITDGQAVFLSLPGEVGYQSPWVYLNTNAPLKDAVARRHYADTVAALKAALQVCIAYPKTPLSTR